MNEIVIKIFVVNCFDKNLVSAGQMVSAEVVRSSGVTCPMELVKVPVPKNDPHFG